MPLWFFLLDYISCHIHTIPCRRKLSQNHNKIKSFLNWRRTRVDDQRSFLPLIQHLKTAWETTPNEQAKQTIHNQSSTTHSEKAIWACVFGGRMKSHAMRCDATQRNSRHLHLNSAWCWWPTSRYTYTSSRYTSIDGYSCIVSWIAVDWFSMNLVWI